MVAKGKWQLLHWWPIYFLFEIVCNFLYELTMEIKSWFWVKVYKGHKDLP